MTSYNIEQLFKNVFGSTPYKVPELSAPVSDAGYQINGQSKAISQISGSTLVTDYNGVEIWLPVWFRNLPAGIGENGALFLPYTVVKISGKKTIIKTPLTERRGTVKEQYNIDDYSISIKGFLIDQARQWPEKELRDIKALFETQQAVSLDNALTNVFLDRNDRVVIENLDIPEVEGGRNAVRPFAMQLESDAVFTLELNS